MKIVNDFILDNIKFKIEYELNSLNKEEIIKIKKFLKKLIKELYNNRFIIIKNYEEYKKYPLNVIKIVSMFNFDEFELIAYYIILFFEKESMKFLSFEIEFFDNDNDMIKIIFDDYSILNKKIVAIIVSPEFRSKFMSFYNFYNKLFN